MTIALLDTSIGSTRCACGSEVAAGLLVCPGCHRLVHADALGKLKSDAETAAASQDVPAELAAWRAAAELLPPGSRQSAVVAQKIASLVADTATPARAAVPKAGPWRWFGGAGAVVVALLSKGKLLLLGLTKATTILSMLAAFGVYWTAWGMWFAAGFVLSIYVHEMGHVAALRRFGLQATAPMFIPGVGAFIRLGSARLTPREDARIGLAGPLWGLGAALVCYVIARAGGGPMFMAIAHTGAWINLFNLMPVWQLDGNRGFAALAKMQRWIVVLLFAAGWLYTRDGLFVLLVIAAVVRTFDAAAPAERDRGALTQFALLIAALSIVFRAAG